MRKRTRSGIAIGVMAIGAATIVIGFSVEGCGPPTTVAKEVHVIKDSVGVYHIDASQKTLRLNKKNHEIARWTFDPDATIDSVTAVFSGTTPFASSHFEFSAAPDSSGPATVAPDTSVVYPYVVTVYPHVGSAINVDPGIIIE